MKIDNQLKVSCILGIMTDYFFVHQVEEGDNMNVICRGGQITGYELSWDLVQLF